MPLKTRIFHEISAVCNRRSNLSEIPISNQSQNPTRDDEALAAQTPLIIRYADDDEYDDDAIDEE